MKFEQYINDNIFENVALLMEGVYDMSIFKVIFLAGGPGSGKSFVASKTTGGLGLKLVNSDILFEIMAKQKNIDIKNFPDSEEEVRDITRTSAKDKTKNKLELHLNNKLGIVVDGTGRHYSNIKKQKDKFEALGYDTYMIFVNTSQEVALERNANRARSVPEKFVKQAWNDVQNNMGKFQTLFGASNFKIIDNNEYTSDDSIFNTAWKEVMKFTKKPVSNHIAKAWIKNELERKKR